MPEPHAPSTGESTQASYIRSFIFGTEDSLVSTVGLLSGVAVAGISKGDIIISGVVLIFVEALSMAVGGFLSEDAAESYLHHQDSSAKQAIKSASIMFGSYFLFGFIPLAPYLVWPVGTALWMSVLAALVTLWLLGYFSARKFGVHPIRRALKMFGLGGAAIVIGVVVGQFISS